MIKNSLVSGKSCGMNSVWENRGSLHEDHLGRNERVQLKKGIGTYDEGSGHVEADDCSHSEGVGIAKPTTGGHRCRRRWCLEETTAEAEQRRTGHTA